MRSSNLMQEVITQLIREKADMDISQVATFYVKFELPHFLPLYVERINPGEVMVAHYHNVNDDLMADPEVIFWEYALPNLTPNLAVVPPQEPEPQAAPPANVKWWPLSITHPLPFGTFNYAEVEPEKGKIKKLAVNGQINLAEFVESWATNIRDQGWLTSATLIDRHVASIER